MRARATRGREHHAAANPAQWLQWLTVMQRRPLDERHEREERLKTALPAPLGQPPARLCLLLRRLEDGRCPGRLERGQRVAQYSCCERPSNKPNAVRERDKGRGWAVGVLAHLLAAA
jgi:hypothetical protein